MAGVKDTWGEFGPEVVCEVGNQIISEWDRAKGWFVYWPHSAAIDGELLKAIATVADLAKEDGWPPVTISALDEAGAHYLMDEAIYYYRRIREKAPGVGAWTSIGGGMALGFDEIGSLSPLVGHLVTNRFTPQIARALAAQSAAFRIASD